LKTPHQIAALPFWISPERSLEVFLVTSRGSGRWIIPKGNPIRGLTPKEVAAREAYEEAGLTGQIVSGKVGSFEFRRLRGSASICHVDAYPLQVKKQVRKWDEQRQRTVLRCDVTTALSLVCSDSLAALISSYSRQFQMGFLDSAG
jgi:8-oxo-dGTP pyrophosphatase MutT (NUDIX family)